MFQLGTPFNDTAINPILPSMGQGDYGQEQGQFDGDYISSDQDPTFSPAGSNLFGLDAYPDDDDDDSKVTSATSSNISTPDFGGYNFGSSFSSSEYLPIPGPATLHLDPIQLQHLSYPDTQLARPPIVRSATNTPSSTYFHRPSHTHQSCRIQQPYHRRSLSQSDADRISSTIGPTFVREVQSQFRSLSSNPSGHKAKKSKLGTATHQKAGGRGRSLEPGGNRGRTNGPTSTPKTDTAIGMSMQIAGPGHIYGQSHDRSRGSRSGDPQFRHMSYDTQLAESPRIIEIGAMAVMRSISMSQKFDDNEEKGENGKDHHGMLLQKLDEMEDCLKQELGYCEKGLKGCEMIREALVNKNEGEEENEEEKTMGDCESMYISIPNMEECAPNTVPSETFWGRDTYTDMDTNQPANAEEEYIFELLMSDPSAIEFRTEGN
ncbi:hypothetical protein K505DRAFT_371071 [Melanomma pulvis-pyrius CBS 109.77]|uniref:Uncharacterized protein n=1 Tax=Melanomma pulvis-pyrius CBS 109.77 TaxID=1314802 RepID=A0A6A6XSB0_9PLEO|nr:hypothetical protein K505DRAFT_371071 [Melanomma pulvis-pyrius CBS 109.77]